MVVDKNLRILLLLDGKAGHETQSKGLLRYFSQAYTCDVQQINVRLRLKPLTRKFFTSLINKGLNAAKAGAIIKGYDLDSAAEAADIIISAGGDTMFLNLALAEHLNATSVFIGSPRKIQLDKFGWLLTLEDYQRSNNIVMPLSPINLDLESMEQQGQQLKQAVASENRQFLSVLVGGNGAGFQYTEADWVNLCDALNQLCHQYNCKLLITTSRRTGEQAEAILQRNLEADNVAEAVWFGLQPRPVMAAYLGAAERVLVTADSMSMISESILSGKPTTALLPAKAQPDSKYSAAMNKFKRNGWLGLVDIADAGSLDAVEVSASHSQSLQQFWNKTVVSIAES